MDKRILLLLTVFVGACLAMGGHRAPTADGNIEGITIAGTITHVPDPIMPVSGGFVGDTPVAGQAGPGAEDPVCAPITTQGACDAMSECRWSPATTTPTGMPLPAECLSAATPDALDGEVTGPMVSYTLDGITADAGYQANLFISDFSVSSLPSTTNTKMVYEQGATSVTLERGSEVFSTGGVFYITICLNKTACDGWDANCAACKSKKVIVGEPEDIPAGQDIDITWPMINLETGHFEAAPSWIENEIETVSGTFLVLETESSWWLNCYLVGLNEGNAANDSLCAPGVFTPNACEPQGPTSLEGSTFEVRLGTNVAQTWKAGGYQVQCEIIDEAGNYFPGSWEEQFEILPTSFVTAPPPAEVVTPGPGETPAPTAEVGATPAPTEDGDLPVLTAGPGGEIPGPVTSEPAQPPPASCGDNVCAEGESQDNCCKDCGCPVGFSCTNDKCVESGAPPAGGGQPNTAVVAVIAILVVVGGFYALGLKK